MDMVTKMKTPVYLFLAFTVYQYSNITLLLSSPTTNTFVAPSAYQTEMEERLTLRTVVEVEHVQDFQF